MRQLTDVQLMDKLIEIHTKMASLDAAVETGFEAVKDRLDKVNGNIGNLWAKTSEHDRQLNEHALDCPVKDKIVLLETQLGKHVSNVTVVAETNRTWRDNVLFPLARYIGVGLLFLFLIHSKEIWEKLF